jgi:hypothetical protein
MPGKIARESFSFSNPLKICAEITSRERTGTNDCLGLGAAIPFPVPSMKE